MKGFEPGYPRKSNNSIFCFLCDPNIDRSSPEADQDPCPIILAFLNTGCCMSIMNPVYPGGPLRSVLSYAFLAQHTGIYDVIIPNPLINCSILILKSKIGSGHYLTRIFQ